jgi:hypothetical protein
MRADNVGSLSLYPHGHKKPILLQGSVLLACYDFSLVAEIAPESFGQKEQT